MTDPGMTEKGSLMLMEGLELRTKESIVLLMCLDQALLEVNRFSSWMKLLCSTAWMLRFVAVCHLGHHCADKELKLRDIQKAEKIWWKQVQRDSFP